MSRLWASEPVGHWVHEAANPHLPTATEAQWRAILRCPSLLGGGAPGRAKMADGFKWHAAFRPLYLCCWCHWKLLVTVFSLAVHGLEERAFVVTQECRVFLDSTSGMCIVFFQLQAWQRGAGHWEPGYQLLSWDIYRKKRWGQGRITGTLWSHGIFFFLNHVSLFLFRSCCPGKWR